MRQIDRYHGYHHPVSLCAWPSIVKLPQIPPKSMVGSDSDTEDDEGSGSKRPTVQVLPWEHKRSRGNGERSHEQAHGAVPQYRTEGPAFSA